MIGQYPGDRSGTRVSIPGGVEAGTPTKVGDNFLDVAGYLGTEDTTISFDAGDSLALALLGDWSYEIPATLSRGLWQIRGTGDITVETGYDTGFGYPSYTTTWTPASEVASDADSRYYPLPSDQLNSADLIDNGAPLVKITCVSGTATITWVGVRIEQAQGMFQPDGGFEWSDDQAADTRVMDNTGTGDTWGTYVDGSTLKWVVDDTEVLLIEDFPFRVIGEGHVDSNDFDVSYAADATDEAILDKHQDFSGGTSTLASWNTFFTGPSLTPPPLYGWHSGIADVYDWNTAPTKSALPTIPPNFPDDLESWNYNGFEYLGTNTDFIGWRLLDPYAGSVDEVEWWLAAGVDSGSTGKAAYSLYIGSADTGGPIPVDGTGTAFVTNEGAPDLNDDIALDSPVGSSEFSNSGQLIASYVSATPDGGLGGGSGGLQARRVSDGAGVAVAWARAVFNVPAWRYKIPTYEPEPTINFGGQLKVWLPSAEWRIIGNEAGSATERLKIQTPDLTWWQEYRTVDGAVTTHPLKLYTADGWVVVSRMTPD